MNAETPTGPFVRPVPQQLNADEIRLEGAGGANSGNEPPELEVIDDPGKPR